MPLKLHDCTLPDRSSYYVSHRHKEESVNIYVVCWLIIGVTIYVGCLLDNT